MAGYSARKRRGGTCLVSIEGQECELLIGVKYMSILSSFSSPSVWLLSPNFQGIDHEI